jgi:hypothetical protein
MKTWCTYIYNDTKGKTWAGSFGKIDSMKNNCITKIIKMKHQDSKLMFFLHPLIAVDSQLLLIYQ